MDESEHERPSPPSAGPLADEADPDDHAPRNRASSHLVPMVALMVESLLWRSCPKPAAGRVRTRDRQLVAEQLRFQFCFFYLFFLFCNKFFV